MSLFKRRGPSQEEIAHENEVKRNIAKELSSALKTIQKEHLASHEAILSTDSANFICGVLEAVFLHGIKDSVSKKIASYMSLTQHNDGSTGSSVNFWQFVSKFTHSDVVTQLKRLGQIYTEIGLCRAWVRVALNDGLMESYVDSMLADKKTLEYFYHRTAYLRDTEQPGILLSYLKGLMLLEFKLSYNSSVLNTWTNTPLSLAGIIDPHDTPLPVIHPNRDKPSTSKQSVNSNEINGEGPATVAVRSVRSRSRGSSSGSDVVPGKKKVKDKTKRQPGHTSEKSPHISVNGDVYAADLSRQDIEEIRGQYAMGSSPHGTEISHCSSSSHISCPDPVKYNKNPSVLVEETKQTNDAIFNLSDDRILELNNAEFNGLRPTDNNLISSASKTKNVDTKTDTLPDFVQHSMHLNHTAENEAEFQSAKNDRMPDITHNTISDFTQDAPVDIVDSSLMSDSGNSRLNKNIEDLPTNDVSHLDISVYSDIGSTSNGNDISDSLIATKPKTVKSKGKKHKLRPNLSPPNKTAVMPELSSAVADSVNTTKFNLSKRLSMPDIRVFQSHSSSPSLMGAISEPDMVPENKPRSESVGNVINIEETDQESQDIVVGNSLGARSGWSSSFDLEAVDTVEPLQCPPIGQTNDGIPIQRSKAESFGSMLKNYTPSSSIASPSIDDVLQDLPESTISSPIKSPQYIEIQEGADNFADEYEIVTNTISSVIDNEDDTQTQLALLPEICIEQGLDACNFQCCGCKRPVGIIYGKPRVCTFDGGYYCFECHENDEYYIPAYIIHNWDFRKHKVAKRNLQFLQDVEDQSLFDISEINSKLYEHVKEMDDIKKLREQLYYLKAYMFTCKQSIAEDFRRSTWPKEYMYETVHRYSFGDLLQVPSGQLSQSLKKTIKFATKHVYDCGLCSQKGFICEICNNPKVIYPFEIEVTYRCLQCKSVFHKSCKTESQQCPKCQRRQARKIQSEPQAETPDSTDYAYSPH